MQAYDMPTHTEGMSDDEFLDLLDQTCDKTFVDELLQGCADDDPEWMTAQHYCGEGQLQREPDLQDLIEAQREANDPSYRLTIGPDKHIHFAKREGC